MSNKIRLFITVGVFALFAFYFSANVDKFKPLLHVNLYLLLIIGTADFMTLVANGLFIKFILKPFDKFISALESVYVSLISSVGNFFAPVGAGFGFRAVYLKKKHNLAYSDFISTLSGNYIIVFLVNSFFALVALYLLRGHPSPQYRFLVIIFLGIFLTSLLLTLIKWPERLSGKPTKNKMVNNILGIFSQIVTGWNKIVVNKRLVLKLTSLVCFNFFLSIIIAKTEITALHFQIGFAQLLLFSVLGSLSLFVNITPANLGVKEAIYIFSKSVIGFSTSQILLIALIDRGVLFLILVILWLVFVRGKDSPTNQTQSILKAS